MVDYSFVVIPTESVDHPADWVRLRRRERMRFMQVQRAALGEAIHERLPEGDLDYLEGMEMWTVRIPGGMARGDLVERLKGLPVQIGDGSTFVALSPTED